METETLQVLNPAQRWAIRESDTELLLPEMEAFLEPFEGRASRQEDDEGPMVCGWVPQEHAQAAAAALKAAGYQTCCESELDSPDGFVFDVWPKAEYPETQALWPEGAVW